MKSLTVVPREWVEVCVIELIYCSLVGWDWLERKFVSVKGWLWSR